MCHWALLIVALASFKRLLVLELPEIAKRQTSLGGVQTTFLKLEKLSLWVVSP
jgi:hypothetical protein